MGWMRGQGAVTWPRGPRRYRDKPSTPGQAAGLMPVTVSWCCPRPLSALPGVLTVAVGTGGTGPALVHTVHQDSSRSPSIEATVEKATTPRAWCHHNIPDPDMVHTQQLSPLPNSRDGKASSILQRWVGETRSSPAPAPATGATGLAGSKWSRGVAEAETCSKLCVNLLACPSLLPVW